MHLLLKLKEGGMDSWIKIICIIALSSCSLINTEFLKKSQPLNITDEIKHARHAMQLIEIDNEFEEIFSLRDSKMKLKLGTRVEICLLSQDMERLLKLSV